MSYSLASSFSQSIGFSVLTPESEYKSEKRVTVRCPEGHDSSFSINALNNKRSAYNNKRVTIFCSTCSAIKNEEDSKQHFIKSIEEKTGHTVISINIQTRKVQYECGNCFTINDSNIVVLDSRSKGYCRTCENWHQKLPYEELKRKVEEMKVVLLTTEEEYTNNKMLLRIICLCGRLDEKCLNDIRRGRGCNEFCKLQKCRDTCMERYGVTNVSKDPVIFERIMNAVYRRKEYSLPSGKIVSLQGYEPSAIDYLLDQKVDKFLDRKIEEDDLSFGKDVPSFNYIDEDGVDRVYHPDFAIGRMIIEVKGDWTLHSQKEKNIKKFQAVNRKGYQMRLLLLYENGEVQEDLLMVVDDDIKQIEELKFREKGRRY